VAHTHADVLEVHLHDSDEPTRFHDVAYTPWQSPWGPAVTVFGPDGERLAEYDDIRHTVARRRHG
jgi:hypothetical protein